MHLTTLRLLEYGAGGALIGSLVKACPSLTVLEVVWHWDSYSGDYLIETQHLIAFDLIAAVVASYAPNLSTLILDDSQQGCIRSFALPEHAFGRHLSGMQHLRHMSASESAFYTDTRDECISKVLSKSLEFLSIIGADDWMADRWAVRHGSHDGRTLRRKQDADLRCLLQDRSLPYLRQVCVNHHAYIDKAVCERSVLDPRLVSWAREARDIYNDDIARNG